MPISINIHSILILPWLPSFCLYSRILNAIAAGIAMRTLDSAFSTTLIVLPLHRFLPHPLLFRRFLPRSRPGLNNGSPNRIVFCIHAQALRDGVEHHLLAGVVAATCKDLLRYTGETLFNIWEEDEFFAVGFGVGC